MNRRLSLWVVLAALAVPASASAQWGPTQPGYGPAQPWVQGGVLQIPHGTRVVNVAGQAHIRHLGHVPPTVEVLDVSGSPISVLPPLPHGLQVLDVSSTQLAALPALPPSLRELRAQGTRVHPGYLPPSLVVCELPYATPAPAYRRSGPRWQRRARVRPRVVVQPRVQRRVVVQPRRGRDDPFASGPRGRSTRRAGTAPRRGRVDDPWGDASRDARRGRDSRSRRARASGRARGFD